LHIPEDDFKTIAGFVFGQLGREPETNDSVFFEGMTFTVQVLEGHRIKTVVLVSELPLELQSEIL
jgi:CBS domain containing-hemolysin-like protein